MGPEVTRSQLDRLWRNLSFRRQHARNLLRWAKTDWERDRWAAEARSLTWQLIEADSRRREVLWDELR